MSRPGAPATRFFWVRHAPVVDHGGRLYGQSDVPADTSDREAFVALAGRLPQGAVWVTSPLRRTRQTAAALEQAGLAPRRSLVEPGIAEQHFGEWQGLRFAEVVAARGGRAHPHWVAAADERPPGGESFLEVCARIRGAVERLAAGFAGADIVAIAHGGSIRAALAHALGLAPEAALAFRIDNLSLTLIEHEVADGAGPVCRVLTVNRAPR